MQTGELADLLAATTSNGVTGWDIFWISIINILLLVAIKFLFDGIDILAGTKAKKVKLNEFINYSSIIGLVERSLYVIGFWTQSFELVTIVIAVKTIMRFTTVSAAEKSAVKGSAGNNQKVTAEKYILGTLINIFVSIVLVWLFK